MIAIIGAGASGLMSAISYDGEDQVICFDGNEKAGKKLYITGKGRCNVTNNCDIATFLQNVVVGSKFLNSALKQFSPNDTISFFEDNGVKLKTERGSRVFPCSDKSSDIITALYKKALTKGVIFRFNEKVLKISKNNDFFYVKTDINQYNFDKIIIATGGCSYSATGSSGDGYNFAEQLGHIIVSPVPAIVPIKLKDDVSELQGLSLKNVELTVQAEKYKKALFGEMLFTSDGISGPIVLSLSSYSNRLDNIKLFLNLKPALTKEVLSTRIMEDISKRPNIQLSNFLREYMPKNLCYFFLKKCKIDYERTSRSLSKAERLCVIDNMQNLPLIFEKFYPIEYAIVTSGGVDTNQVNPKTMESKLIPGLYFVGEVLNLDALTGGFNIQIAFSTGYVAGKNVGG